MGLSVGVCGAGSFAPAFIPLFLAHPWVTEVSIAELVPDKLETAKRTFGVERGFSSFDELLESDVDAVAIFTQHHLHGPMAIAALTAGKHVYSAVPIAVSLDDVRRIVELADAGRSVYMMGETSYYYPSAIYCRTQMERGAFGEFVYGEGEYLHDMSHGLYDVFKQRHGDGWEAMASIPPMFYPTHSFSLVLSVVKTEVQSLSCYGSVDHGDDGIFDRTISTWGNDFSNEFALCSLSGGGVARVNEMRRVGTPGAERLAIFGTDSAFEEGGGRAFLHERAGTVTDLTDQLRRDPPASSPEGHARRTVELDTGWGSSHPALRLPVEFRGLPNGHYGSHHFLVDDFVRACVEDSPPRLNARVAASYCAPGLVAHESAVRGGVKMEVPSFLA